MAEKLTPATWEKWNAKLENWALCFGGSRSDPERSAPVSDSYQDLENWRDYGTDFKRETQAATWEAEEPPGINIDAMDTNSLVIMLPIKLYDAVDAFWALSGPVDCRAAAIGVSVPTLYRHRDEAVVELDRMDGVRRGGRRINPVTGKTEVGVVVRRSQFVPDDWAS